MTKQPKMCPKNKHCLGFPGDSNNGCPKHTNSKCQIIAPKKREAGNGIKDMSVDEIADMMGADLSVALFKGQFHDKIIRWAMIFYNLAHTTQPKPRRRK